LRKLKALALRKLQAVIRFR